MRECAKRYNNLWRMGIGSEITPPEQVATRYRSTRVFALVTEAGALRAHILPPLTTTAEAVSACIRECDD